MQTVTNKSATDSSDKTVVVLCETAGEDLFAIGGGYDLGGSTNNVIVTTSRPNGLAGEVPAGWRVEAEEIGLGQAGNWSVTAYAVCGTVQDAL